MEMEHILRLENNCPTSQHEYKDKYCQIGIEDRKCISGKQSNDKTQFCD